jgi:hypothetical protein
MPFFIPFGRKHPDSKEAVAARSLYLFDLAVWTMILSENL